MKKTVLISAYFGSFPNYFNLWLKSAGSNESIDFLIFSDCNCSKYTPLPHNVKIVKTDFEALRKRIQSCYDFNLALNTPYKLCDFKPAYGEIFGPEIRGYDYWGNCDLDMIFGNIEKMADDALASGSPANTAKEVTKADIVNIYKSLFS